MKTVFLDTNIAIDFLLNRRPFSTDALDVIKTCHVNSYHIYASSLSFSNIAYILRKQFKDEELYMRLSALREIVAVSKVNEEMVDASLSLRPHDFEDALQYFSALSAGADCIVTRNVCDFSFAEIPVLKPSEFLSCYSE